MLLVACERAPACKKLTSFNTPYYQGDS